MLCTYDDGVKLLMRDAGWPAWAPVGPLRRRPRLGRTGDSGKMKTSPSVRSPHERATAGTDATIHIAISLICIRRADRPVERRSVANSHTPATPPT